VSDVIAALDNSIASTPVLATAVALAELFNAEVTPVHVSIDGARVAENVAARAGLELKTRSGPVIDGLLEELEAEHAVALVIGARGMPGDRRPLGSTAVAIATASRKPVVIVPPDARLAASLQRALIPIEDGLSAALMPRAIIGLGEGATVDVVAVHVQEPALLPAFTDQPQHEQPAWAREFLRRYCPWGIGTIRLEIRVGNAADIIPAVAEEEAVDIIALAWAQELAEGRAPVIRAALGRARAPIMLVPVEVPTDQLRAKETPWSSLQSSPA
jgi:nucleotide-binding universal stress UspA family protein